MITPTLPAGFRDMDADAFASRAYIIAILEEKFIQYGFQPLATPAMEKLTTLLGKYGEEGDQLLFKVLNSGDCTRDLQAADIALPASQFAEKISKKGLRYDLTVPLARYVVQNKHKLVFPFKRYQIQPVWRGERPQQGRYREFYQCDVDIVGSGHLFHEASLLVMSYEALMALGITDFVIYLNHRQLLSALATHLGFGQSQMALYQTLDKKDKIGKAAVEKLLIKQGLSNEGGTLLGQLFAQAANPFDECKRLAVLLGGSTLAAAAIKELTTILDYIGHFNQAIIPKIVLDATLARGMAYYTGAIFEVKVPHSGVGSIVGGGRYDDLTAIFGLKEMPGVGLSFGLARIYDIMKARQSFPPHLGHTTQILLVPMAQEMESIAINHLTTLHKAGIAAELYPAGRRMKKSFAYADKKHIPWVAIIGAEEVASGQLSLKNMQTGHQAPCTCASLLITLKGENKPAKE